MPGKVYSEEDFKRIAAAIDVSAADVRRRQQAFEAAALWFRLSGTAFEGRNPTELRRKLQHVASAARALLKVLGVADAKQAADGPGDREVFDVLTFSEGSSEDLVVEATERIGRLVEILEAIQAANSLEQVAEQAAVERTELGRLTVPPGNSGDRAVNDWVAAIIGIYKQITGKSARTSVGAPGRGNEGKAGGPFIRLLQTAGKPINKISDQQIPLSAEALRRRIRTILS